MKKIFNIFLFLKAANIKEKITNTKNSPRKRINKADEIERNKEL